MSTLKVDTLNGSTGSTITVPSGQTLAVAGTLTTTGTFNPTADITVSGNISNDAISIVDNKISTIRTNDNLILDASGTGKVDLNGLLFPSSDGTAGQVIKTDGSGNLSFTTISSTAISQLNTNVTVTDSGTNGTVTIACDGNTEMTVTDDGVRVHGNLTVDGVNTVINTTTLSVEDNVIELNRNVSNNAGMPSYSGLKVNRGEGIKCIQNKTCFGFGMKRLVMMEQQFMAMLAVRGQHSKVPMTICQQTHLLISEQT